MFPFLLLSGSAAAAAAPAVQGTDLPLALAAMLGVAFCLGLLHALDADHVAAVTVFVSRAPRPLPAALVSLRWGVGHMLTVVALGGAATLLGVALPEQAERYAELAVGLVLVILGVWILKDFVLRKIHLHVHGHARQAAHVHLHAHEGEPTHGHRHSPLLVGVVHGAAGSAPALVLVPVSAKASAAAAVLYLGVFSAGVLLAMVALGVAASLAMGALAARREALYRSARYATGTASALLGLYWIADRLVL